MSDEILRYTDLAALIQMAKARGWPTERIVREMSAGDGLFGCKEFGAKSCSVARYNRFGVYAAS